MTNTHQHQLQKGRYLAYLRVSTPKQGEGVSLITQREAIAKFAANNRLEVVDWLEEKESAAKRGRPVFGTILKKLREGKADGLIVYKVDRSARNLKDWADLGDLIDKGIPVHFAGEGLDLATRSGRLAADIQAIIAADFVRNLREETNRGMQKRLEQGFFPLGAPIGYLDRGGGKAKVIDPERGWLVKLAFVSYASGDYTLRKLAEFLAGLGLRNRRGNPVTLSGLSHFLRNPFYMGYIKFGDKRELYQGLHEPLITKELFFRVQERLRVRIAPRKLHHRFKYSRMLKCLTCNRCLIGSERKGWVYYRCATMICPTVSVRKDRVENSNKKQIEWQFVYGDPR
ncbi:MAG TPA: recombinase family protein [Thermoanaerobaculia bacterium]|jgi:DNA invertase Pin-like site-specific DNA recombinase|nr:recombinase family protein [Thermoanaerobaculia bacterium]